MSAINLYTTKAEALYVKDSHRNSFYEYGGIQLLPNVSYTQNSNGIELANAYSISVLSVSDDTVLGQIPYSIQEQTNSSTIYADSETLFADSVTLLIDTNSTGTELWSIASPIDFGNQLIYLRFKSNSVANIIVNLFATRVLGDSAIIEAENCLNNELLNLLGDSNHTYYYTNPFYITSLDEDECTKIEYKDLSTEINQSIGLKIWFRQKSRQSELTTYYESSTKNTVTQAIKTHSLELYESEFMSIDDLILTATLLESAYLFINGERYNLFEAIKIPELTQQENFGKIKFTLSSNN